MNKTIMILAIGGAGCNMAETIIQDTSKVWLKEADYVFADTDIDRLKELSEKDYQSRYIQLDNDGFYLSDFSDVETLYILAGMGGKTGSSFIKKAVEMAKKAGVSHIAALVTIPFLFEGNGRIQDALLGIDSVSGITLKVLNNESLFQQHPDLDFTAALKLADHEIMKIIESGEVWSQEIHTEDI